MKGNYYGVNGQIQKINDRHRHHVITKIKNLYAYYEYA